YSPLEGIYQYPLVRHSWRRTEESRSNLVDQNRFVVDTASVLRDVHVGRGAPIQISKVRSIGHKAPGIDRLPPRVHCRQPILGRQVHEASALVGEHVA